MFSSLENSISNEAKLDWFNLGYSSDSVTLFFGKTFKFKYPDTCSLLYTTAWLKFSSNTWNWSTQLNFEVL